jgi:hypothetical protein
MAVAQLSPVSLLSRVQSSGGVEPEWGLTHPPPANLTNCLSVALSDGLDVVMQCSSAQPLPLPALPYEYDALHPFYSDAALKLHRQFSSHTHARGGRVGR